MVVFFRIYWLKQMLLLIILLACTESKTDWTTQFKEDPAQTKVLLSEIPDLLERLSIIEELNKEFAGKTTELCSLLDSTTKVYCEEQNLRPHLWSTLKTPVSVPKNSVKGQTTDCDNRLCVQELAQVAARKQDLSEAKAICLSISEEKWQSECIFSTAEQLVKNKKSNGYAIAAELCDHATVFADNCHQHLIQQLAKHAPDADTKSDWANIYSAHHAIRSTWSWKNKDTMKRLQERLWAESLGISYSGVSTITGNPFDAVPKEYHAHVRAGAAYRFFQLEESPKQDLSAWSKDLAQKLSLRSERPDAINQQRKFMAAPNFGAQELSTEDSILYLATSRRLISDDVATDITICLLEAEIRKPPVNRTLIEEGLTHPSSKVQETAIRLLKNLDSQDN